MRACIYVPFVISNGASYFVLYVFGLMVFFKLDTTYSPGVKFCFTFSRHFLPHIIAGSYHVKTRPRLQGSYVIPKTYNGVDTELGISDLKHCLYKQPAYLKVYCANPAVHACPLLYRTCLVQKAMRILHSVLIVLSSISHGANVILILVLAT